MLGMRETQTFMEILQAETTRRDGPGPENEEGGI
jgi:hypothetical protein